MKAALLMCGQPRTVEFCFPSFKKNILDVYSPDVFLCSDSSPKLLADLFNPVAMEVASQDYILEQVRTLRKDHQPEVVPDKVLSIGWKLYRCVQLLKEYQIEKKIKYDVVIISRFDVKLLTVQRIKPARKNTIYIPKVDAYPEVPQHIVDIYPEEFADNLHWGGYSTHVWWMSVDVAEFLCSAYFTSKDNNRMATAAKKEWGENPEHVLKWFCDQNGIKAEYVEIDMMLIRGTSDSPLAFNYQPLSSYPRFMEETK